MDYAKEFAIPPREKVSLSRIDPQDTRGLADKKEGVRLLKENVKRIAELQNTLYAENTQALLVIFQAMDAAGKDGTIRGVTSGVNPAGFQVASFKQPSREELDHDYLWRCMRHLPERGRIGIFNRSYYEEVLVVRVHPQILASQPLPTGLKGADIWSRRFDEIVDFENHLAGNGTAIVKFFLHISKEEQRERFLARLDDPSKNWKFSLQDVREREHWSTYMHAYEEAISATSAACAPWYVIPANHKWFARAVVAEIIAKTLESMDPEYPKLTAEARAELQTGKKLLGVV